MGLTGVLSENSAALSFPDLRQRRSEQRLATPMPRLHPLRFLFVTFAGWVNRQQGQAIDYLVYENRILKEQLGGKRLKLTDDQRRRLAARGKALGRRLLRWHRRLIAASHTYPHKNRVGRPGIMRAIRELIVRMAKDNTSWGYCRIQDELKKLGRRVARSTIAKTLKDQGVPPSPGRPTSWRTFLKAHAEVIAATDFFTVDVWTKRGLVTHYVLFVIHHASRVVEIAGVTTNPNGEFMAQVARNLTDSVDGFLRNKRFLILDRDRKFTEQFRRVLEDSGVSVVTTAYQAPDMNAVAERFVGSVKRECLDRMILFGERYLRCALQEFVEHYHRDRPHQGIRNELIAPSSGAPSTDGQVVADERLGGLLRSYRRVASRRAHHTAPGRPSITATGSRARPNCCVAHRSALMQNETIRARIAAAEYFGLDGEAPAPRNTGLWTRGHVTVCRTLRELSDVL